MTNENELYEVLHSTRYLKKKKKTQNLDGSAYSPFS